MEKDITQFIEECREKGGFMIVSYDSGLTKDSPEKLSVEFANQTFDIPGSFAESFEVLQKRVAEGYKKLFRSKNFELKQAHHLGKN